MQRKLSYLSDRQLIPRVHKYLESNVGTTYDDIGLMADRLQSTYREYSKKKRDAFRNCVKKAYAIILRSYDLDTDQKESSSEDNLEQPESDNSRGDQIMKNQLFGLYTISPVANKDSGEMNKDDVLDVGSSNGPFSLNKGGESLQSSSNIIPKPRKQKTNKKKTVQGIKRKLDMTDLATSSGEKKETLAIFQEPSISFKDVAGMGKTLLDIHKRLSYLIYPELYQGGPPPRTLLLVGPPGCGKTHLANAIAGEFGIPLLEVSATQLVAGVFGESEERIRELFERAVSTAPCVLFIDDIDVITSNNVNAQKDMEKRIVAQLRTCLDGLNKNPNAHVLVIGATNSPDSLDLSLKRSGRFAKEIRLGIPNEEARIAILKLHTSHYRLAPDFDWHFVGTITPGYVGADLLFLISEAVRAAYERTLEMEPKKADELSKLKRIESEKSKKTKKHTEADKSEPEIIVDNNPKVNNEGCEKKQENSKQWEKTSSQTAHTKLIGCSEVDPFHSMIEERSKRLHTLKKGDHKEIESIIITTEDFREAAKQIQPSANREGFSTVPDVSWDDIGSLKDIREELTSHFLDAVRRDKVGYHSLDLTMGGGVLLFGPPGCGKTLVAQALANEAGINFILVKGPELLNMYVGESERAVRQCFERAKNLAPCVIFFDEADALFRKRSGREGAATRGVVNQLLSSMGGFEDLEGVFVLAATNRPDIIDPAARRPGRFSKTLYVGIPSASDRVEILKTITKNGSLLAPDVDLESIGRSDKLSGYTGADLKYLVIEAKRNALKEDKMSGHISPITLISNCHFQQAIAKTKPSTSEKDRKKYERLKKRYSSTNF